MFSFFKILILRQCRFYALRIEFVSQIILSSTLIKISFFEKGHSIIEILVLDLIWPLIITFSRDASDFTEIFFCNLILAGSSSIFLQEVTKREMQIGKINFSFIFKFFTIDKKFTY